MPIPLAHPVPPPGPTPGPDPNRPIKIGVPIGLAAVVGLVLFALYLRGSILRRRRGADGGELPAGEDPGGEAEFGGEDSGGGAELDGEGPGGEAELEGQSGLPPRARPPIILSGDTDMIDTSKELVRNQPYSEYASPPLPEHLAPGAVGQSSGKGGGAEHSAPEVYLLPAPTSSEIDEELRRIEEQEADIRLRREAHEEVLRLRLEEDRLRNRKAELLMARRDG